VSPTPVVLVIAGSDSSGGAGLTRDVTTLSHFGVEARCVITAVTAQSDTRVSAVHPVPEDIIRAQLAAALSTGPVDAIKIGMLGNKAAVLAVRAGLPQGIPVVLDPVLVSSSGGVLLAVDGRQALGVQLMPRVTLLTPNIPEAAAMLDEPVADTSEALITQGQRLRALGAAAVLLKGGHADGPEAVDYLIEAQGVRALTSPRLSGTRRGTGCTLASGVAAGLAAGLDLLAACERARAYVLARLSGVG
jgi:hydroxymethylpyrimidine/phosphomethylpyrimidine kinase